MKTIEAKVYRLPTENASRIMMFGGTDLIYSSVNKKGSNRFHLYITTDEEIKEGDWYIHPDATVPQNNFSFVYIDCRKIIATTDPKILGKSKITETKKAITHSIFPSIPHSFIEEYCKAGGIDKVLVECKRIPHFDIEYSHGGLRTEKFNGVTYEDTNEPKLNSDNTIIIHPVEEKMYSRNEMFKAFIYGFQNNEGKLEQDLVSILMDRFDKWIEENL